MLHEKKVDFLCIGAQKAGTTWLYEVLQNHTGLYLSPRKELNYFSKPINKAFVSLFTKKGMGCLYRNIKHIKHNISTQKIKRFITIDFKFLFLKRTDAWYISFFKKAPKNARIGEITPNYSIMPTENIVRAYKYNPEMKIILILRNPVDRAWSLFRMDVKNNFYQDDTSLVKDIINHIESDPDYYKKGDYVDIIKKWTKIFPEKNLYIAFYSDIKNNPEKIINNIFSHIGVSEIVDFSRFSLHKKIFKGIPIVMPRVVKKYLISKHRKGVEDLYAKMKNKEILTWLD